MSTELIGNVRGAYPRVRQDPGRAGREVHAVLRRVRRPVARDRVGAQESEAPEKAKAFVAWLREPKAQKVFAAKGYRTVREELTDEKTYPQPKALFKIDKFGGWDKVNDAFFDSDLGSVAKIEQDLGVSTAK